MSRPGSPLLSKGDVVKRRACDECRERKVKCSGDLDGCSRCAKDGLSCFYSAQKPMGRPKKQMSPEAECQGHNLARELNPEEQQQLSSLSFAEDQIGLTTTTTEPVAHTYKSGRQFAPFVGGIVGVNILADIAFGHRNPAVDTITEEGGFPAPEKSTSYLSSAAELDPQTTEGAGGSPERRADASCRCLSRIFSALDALSRLPDKVEDAIYIARGASKTVHDIANCAQCGLRPFRQSALPPIRPSQNLTMLMAIFPAIASAYDKVLELADAKATQATLEGRSLVFKLGRYGGAWGQTDWKRGGCIESHDNLTLDADSWKRMVRALLRADLHGHGKYQTGLWEIIQEIKSTYISTPGQDHHSTTHFNAPLPTGCELGSPLAVDTGSRRASDGEEEEFSKVVEEAQYALRKLIIS